MFVSRSLFQTRPLLPHLHRGARSAEMKVRVRGRSAAAANEASAVEAQRVLAGQRQDGVALRRKVGVVELAELLPASVRRWGMKERGRGSLRLPLHSWEHRLR